jgi:hypothetical protein
MGKKFGINTKAEEARERKASQNEQKKQELAKKKEVEEAKLWDQGANHNHKKEVEEAKRLDKLAKKKERELLEKAEMDEISNSSKHRHYQLNSRAAKSAHPCPSAVRSKKTAISDSETNNGNEPFQELPQYSASNIDDALALMEAATSNPTSTALEKHPERRMEAAYKRFEEIQLPILKREHPGLRHSQLKERLFRLWKKSPDNPMNQLHVSHRTTREEELALIQSQNVNQLEQFRIKKDS